MSTVAFKCQDIAEANLMRNAVNLYRHTLREQGVDPRNYAPATAEGAGFGWDAVQRAVGNMGTGTVTHMSPRMAEAIRLALVSKAAHTTDQYARVQATETSERLAALIKRASEEV